MTIPRLLLPKKNGIFKEDKEAGVYTSITINGTLQGPNNTTTVAAPVTYEKVYLVDLRDYASGNQVSIPIIGNIVDRVPLTSGKTVIDNIRVKLVLLKKKGNNKFGFAMTQVIAFSQKFPLPLDPLSQDLVRAVGDLTSGLLADDKENNVDKKVPTADLTLNFSSSGNCNSTQWETGAYVIVDKGLDPKAPGYLDIGGPVVGKCFVIQRIPYDALLVGTKSGSDCTNHVPVSNNYTLMLLAKDI